MWSWLFYPVEFYVWICEILIWFRSQSHIRSYTQGILTLKLSHKTISSHCLWVVIFVILIYSCLVCFHKNSKCIHCLFLSFPLQNSGVWSAICTLCFSFGNMPRKPFDSGLQRFCMFVYFSIEIHCVRLFPIFCDNTLVNKLACVVLDGGVVPSVKH